MLNKANPKSRAVVDVPADNPDGTLDRFNAGLRKVLEKGKIKDRAPDLKRPKRRKS